MRQRILIAAALAMRPALLIADEPTTALDVTVQAGILDLLMRLSKELDLGILLITHDLAVVAETCQRVNVMYAGQVVESNEVVSLFAAPRHPYTQGLLGSILSPQSRRAFAVLDSRQRTDRRPLAGRCRFHPRCPIARTGLCDNTAPELRAHGTGADRCHLSDESITRRRMAASRGHVAMSAATTTPPLLEARELSRLFPVRAQRRAVPRPANASRGRSRVPVDPAGEVLALVGESGSGKTTLGRMLLGLTTPSEGSILTRAWTSRPVAARRRAVFAAKSRWCSRTPADRSILAAPSARASRFR